MYNFQREKNNTQRRVVINVHLVERNLENNDTTKVYLRI